MSEPRTLSASGRPREARCCMPFRISTPRLSAREKSASGVTSSSTARSAKPTASSTPAAAPTTCLSSRTAAGCSSAARWSSTTASCRRTSPSCSRRPLSALALALPVRFVVRRPALGSVLMVLLVLALGFVTLYPILAIVGNGTAVSQGGATRLGWSAWRSVFAQPGVAPAMLNTLKVVGTVQLVSFPIAIFVSWLLARTDLPLARWLEFGFWVSFRLPALGTTTGWLLFFAPDYGLINGWITKSGLLSSPPFDMYTFWGIVFAHLATYSISVKVMLMVPAFKNLDSSLEEASWVCGASRLKALAQVVVPLLTPMLLVTFLMSLIKALEAFEIELVLGARTSFSVYSTKIYQLLQGSPPDYGSATVLGLAVLALMVVLIVLQRLASMNRSYVTVSGRFKANPHALGRWRWTAFAVVAGLIVF